MVRAKSRKTYTHEMDLIKIFQKWKRTVDAQITRMRQLSYTQDEINDTGSKFYKEVCRKSFETHRLSLKTSLWPVMTTEAYSELLKWYDYTNFWKELHKFDLKLYGRASLLFK